MPREVKIKIPECKVLIIRTWSGTVQVGGTSLSVALQCSIISPLLCSTLQVTCVFVSFFFTSQVSCLPKTSISFGKYLIKGIKPVILREIVDYL